MIITKLLYENQLLQKNFSPKHILISIIHFHTISHILMFSTMMKKTTRQMLGKPLMVEIINVLEEKVAKDGFVVHDLWDDLDLVKLLNCRFWVWFIYLFCKSWMNCFYEISNLILEFQFFKIILVHWLFLL